jgi:hypothetical protein
MTHTTQRRAEAAAYLPGRGEIVAAAAVSTAAWLLAAGGLFLVVSFLPDVGWSQVVSLAVLCGAPQGAIWATRHARTSRRIRATVPRKVLETRLHGNLDAAVGGEGRSLRPIGTTTNEIAARTGSLLGHLIELPGVRIFHGVRCQNSTVPLVAHAVTAGRLVILVESVAWPGGRYELDEDGRIRCDGIHIGQSVVTLMAAVRYWRGVLPRSHRVSALIVVHPAGTGEPRLPAGTVVDLAWTTADDVLALISERVPRRPAVSTRSFAALVAATASG